MANTSRSASACLASCQPPTVQHPNPARPREDWGVQSEGLHGGGGGVGDVGDLARACRSRLRVWTCSSKVRNRADNVVQLGDSALRRLDGEPLVAELDEHALEFAPSPVVVPCWAWSKMPPNVWCAESASSRKSSTLKSST